MAWHCRARRPARAKVMEGPSTALRACSITAASPAAVRQLQAKPVSRRSPSPWGQGRAHCSWQRRRASPRGSARLSPNRCCRASRAANSAGGSGSSPVLLAPSSSSAMPGRLSSAARLASESDGSARIRPKASMSSSSRRLSLWPAARASTAWRSSSWPASQRANGSLSRASRWTSSAVGRPISSFTGAENWRNNDSAGG